jgi:hypothetical protein
VDAYSFSFSFALLEKNVLLFKKMTITKICSPNKIHLDHPTSFFLFLAITDYVSKAMLGSQVWWHMPVIPALWRLRQEDCKFGANLSNTVRRCPNKQNNNTPPTCL